MNDASAVRRRRLRTGLSYGVLVAIAIVFLFPFVIAVVTSFKTEPDATANPLTLIPSPFTTEAYSQLFNEDFLLWVKNSVFVTLSVTSPVWLTVNAPPVTNAAGLKGSS